MSKNICFNCEKGPVQCYYTEDALIECKYFKEKAFDSITREVKAMQEPKYGEWINAKVLCPKERGKYLCSFYGNGQEVLYRDGEEWYDKQGIRNPVYWMPLPEPPKEI